MEVWVKNRILTHELWFGLFLLFLPALSNPAWALSPWSRRYTILCTTGHTVLPRHYGSGERCKWNRCPDPDEPGGDTLDKSHVNPALVINRVGNWQDESADRF